MKYAVVGVLLTLCACGQDPTPDITGTVITRIVGTDRELDILQNLTIDFDAEALVPDLDGALTRIPAIGASDRTFVIPDVPQGLVFVRRGQCYHYDYGTHA